MNTFTKILFFFLTVGLLCKCSDVTNNSNCDNKIDNLENVSQKIQVEIDTIYLDKEFLVLGKKDTYFEVVRHGKTSVNKGDTLFSDEYITLIGDKNIDIEIFIKFKQRYKFSDFPIDIYQGKLSEPDLSTNPKQKRYVTKITEESEKRPNFAGNLNIINWSCGTNCISGVIVNSETGKVYDLLVASSAFKSKPNSKLLIAGYGLFKNQANVWLPFCGFCIPEYFLWDENKGVLIKLK